MTKDVLEDAIATVRGRVVMRRGFGDFLRSFGMLSRVLVLSAIFSSVLCSVKGQGYPCFTAERIPGRDRRFFAFVPSNVRSNPPVECVFLFGGPPGTRLRMTAYDVQTSGSSASGGRCTGAALRVYDVGRRGLQLVATYCGFVRRGQLLVLSSNMAVVTFMSYNNVMNNAFSLVIDSVEREAVQRLPCPSSTAAATEPATTRPTTPIPSTTTTTFADSTSESSEESDSSSSESSGYADEEERDEEERVGEEGGGEEEEDGGDEDLEEELEERKEEEEEEREEEEREEKEREEDDEIEVNTKPSKRHKGNELYDYVSLENTTHLLIPDELQQIL